MSVATYETIYRRQAAGEPVWQRYGHSNHGSMCLQALARAAKANAWRVLDVGCGHNEFAKSLREMGVDAKGADPACPGADVVYPLNRKLGWVVYKDTTIRADVVTSFDVLEHLPPSEIGEALEALKLLAPRFVLSIDYRPSINMLDGANLHETVQPESWWLARLHALGAKTRKFGVRFIVGTWDGSEPDFMVAGVARCVLALPLGDGHTDHGETLVIGPGANPEIVRQWATRCAENGCMEAKVEVDNSSPAEVPIEVIESIRDIMAVAMADVVTATDAIPIMDENVRINAQRIVEDGVSGNVAVPPGRPGCTVVILGAGPSVTDETLDELFDLYDENPDVELYVTDRATTNPRIREWYVDAVVTLEPRPVKLDAKDDSAITIAHVFANPGRIPNGLVAWCQQSFVHYFFLPGWVPEIPPVRSVTGLAVWAASLVRPKRIVLLGCDHALKNGQRYASSMAPTGNGELNPPERHMLPAIGGGTVESMPNYMLGVYELKRAAVHLAALKIETINATSSGAAIGGWKEMSLAEALAPTAQVGATTIA